MKLLLLLTVFAAIAQGIFAAPTGLQKKEPEEKPPPKKPPPKKPDLEPMTQKPLAASHQEPKDEEPTPGAFEGDMMLTDDQLRQIEMAIDDLKTGRKKRKAVINENARWTSNIVPYEITPSSSDDAQVIRAAMDHWEQYTCLRFEPLNSSHASQLRHNTSLSFIKGDGCWSYVGRAVSGEQQISIGSGCEDLGIVAHEIGHAIGFHHEQSRPDRDEYINVHFENIRSGFEHNFEKYDWNEVTTRNVEYDVGSVMHYGPRGFSVNGQPTITTIDPLQMHLLGNREGLSTADITLANLIYECDNECSTTEQCQNGGYHDSDCNCVCPPGYSGELCQDDSGPTTTPSCIQRLTDTLGEITSPNYPSNYDNYQECAYLIEGAPGSSIELTFVDMDIESENDCGYDAVEVRTDDVNSIGEKFCGNTIPPVQISSSNQMLIYFTSDSSVTRRGFRATYVIQNGSTIEIPTTTPPSTNPPVIGTCGGNFVENQGSLTSPNYPSNYDNDQECMYLIEVAPGSSIELTFVDMDIESGNNCGFDAVEVRTDDISSIGEKFCGNTIPPVQISSSNQMLVSFTSDYSVTRRGFRATYVIQNGSTTEIPTTTPPTTTPPTTTPPTTTPPTTNPPTTNPPVIGTCGGNFVDNQGSLASPNYPSNYDNGQDCMYLIEGAPGSSIELTFVDMDIEHNSLCSYDAVEVWTDDISSIGEKFCGNTLPPVQISSSNQMLISFTSDYSVTRRGFRATYVIQGGSTTEIPTTTPPTTTPPTTNPPTTNPPVIGTCGGGFVENQGSLASPNYPNNYDDKLQCVYVIEVEADRRVELTFTDFSLEKQSECSWDTLDIDLGDGVEVPMKMCGNEYPVASLVSIGNRMELTLKTDGSVNDRGFRADYRAIDL